MRIHIVLIASVLSVVTHQASLRAAEVVAHFTTTVQQKTSGTPPLPPELAGIAVGAPVSGTIRYNTSAPAVPNPYGGPDGQATMYEPPGMTISEGPEPVHP